MARTMRAVVLTEPGPVENLVLRDLPVPDPPPGWVRIAIRAFGLNRSELHTRLGLAEGVTFPRVLGIEAVGVVDVASGTDLSLGPVHVYALEQIRHAQTDMEQNRTFGKMVVTISP